MKIIITERQENKIRTFKRRINIADDIISKLKPKDVCRVWNNNEKDALYFDEMLSYGWIDKVKPEFDDYWYNRNFDESYFNEVVSDRLHEYLNN